MGGKKHSELHEIVTFMRKNGILVYRNANFEIKISRQAFKLPTSRLKKQLKLESDNHSPANGEDFLLWSAGDVDLESAR